MASAGCVSLSWIAVRSAKRSKGRRPFWSS
jgi:hypothetical protein